jgi:hypothetical protein
MTVCDVYIHGKSDPGELRHSGSHEMQLLRQGDLESKPVTKEKPGILKDRPSSM